MDYIEYAIEREQPFRIGNDLDRRHTAQARIYLLSMEIDRRLGAWQPKEKRPTSTRSHLAELRKLAPGRNG